jgi:hypothetical protein
VISNGTRLHIKEVQDALLEHVTSVRISMYDWQEKDTDIFLETLDNIRKLRDRAKMEGSRLEIGAAMLTRREWNERIKPVGLKVLDAGVDWLYFHPYCVDWEIGRPIQADQGGVMQAIEELIKAAPEDSNIQTPYERYSKEQLFFNKLHGAHFLIQVGADGINYAGPECKYNENYALLDLNEYMEDGFLWHPKRLERLERINSGNYEVIGTRHRPPMFSDYIEKVMKSRDSGKGASAFVQRDKFLYPEII